MISKTYNLDFWRKPTEKITVVQGEKNARKIKLRLFSDGKAVDPLEANVLTNLIQNGDFSDGNEHWVFSPLAQIINGVMTVDISDGVQFNQENLSLINGRKYYLFFLAKSLNGNGRFNFRLQKEMGVTTSNILSYSNVSTSYQSYSGILTASSDGERLRFANTFTPNEFVFFDYVGLVDLTEKYGAGNEPTAEEFGEIVEKTGYFEELNLNGYILFEDGRKISCSVENNQLVFTIPELEESIKARLIMGNTMSKQFDIEVVASIDKTEYSEGV